jgi:hypothetical protein
MISILFLILSKTSNGSLAGILLTYSIQLTDFILYLAYMYCEF